MTKKILYLALCLLAFTISAAESAECDCGNGYKCNDEKECVAVTCDAADACSFGSLCVPYKKKCNSGLCKQFQCVDQCAMTLCAAGHQCVPTLDGPKCEPLNCYANDHVCPEGTTCVDSDVKCIHEPCAAYECVNTTQFEEENNATETDPSKPVDFYVCNAETNYICQDPYNYACDRTRNQCVPIDCGASEACADDEECISVDRICNWAPCEQFVCEKKIDRILKEEKKGCTTTCGKEVEIGQGFTDDGSNFCNVCACSEDGTTICTMMFCDQDSDEAKCADGEIETQVDDSKCETSCGREVDFGVTFFDDGANYCNVCTCSESGGKACTKMFCEESPLSSCALAEIEPPKETFCETKCGLSIPPGITFKDDGSNFCNSCRCTLDGEKVCTKMACDDSLEEAEC